MRTVQYYATILLFFVSLFQGMADEKREKIKFSRPLHPGDRFQCAINATLESTTLREYTGGVDKKEEKKREIKLKGILFVLGVNGVGNLSAFEFKVEKIEGVIDKVPFLPEWKNKTIVADLAAKPEPSFLLKETGSALPKNEQEMLSLIFHPVSNVTTADLIGTDQPVKIGDSWSVPTAPVIKIFRNEGVELKEKNIEGDVKLKSEQIYKQIKCREIDEVFSIKDIPGLQYDFSLNILLPFENALPVIKVIKVGKIRIEKIQESSHPMLAGIKRIVVVNKNKMSAEMIAVKKGEEK